jgi:hypothetical protein
MDMNVPSEKIAYETKEPIMRDPSIKLGDSLEDREVFKAGVDGLEYRTVTWQRAVIIFIKTQIATGVLGIPSSLYVLGAVGGGLCVVGFQALNLCSSHSQSTPHQIQCSTNRRYVQTLQL